MIQYINIPQRLKYMNQLNQKIYIILVYIKFWAFYNTVNPKRNNSARDSGQKMRLKIQENLGYESKVAV